MSICNSSGQPAQELEELYSRQRSCFFPLISLVPADICWSTSWSGKGTNSSTSSSARSPHSRFHPHTRLLHNTATMARHSSAIPIVRPGSGKASAPPVIPALPKTPKPADVANRNSPFPSSEPNRDGRVSVQPRAFQPAYQHLPNSFDRQTAEAAEKSLDTRHKHAELTSPQHPPGAKSLDEDEDEDEASAFNVYARPFVPTWLSVVNTLPGRTAVTQPIKHINYDAFIADSLGPVAGFLPTPPNPSPPLPPGSITSLDPRVYEAFFQHHLGQEIEAAAQEIDAYALYGHQVLLWPVTPSSPPDQTICTLQVPGLRENSPYVEEDDVVQLRQLRYGPDGKLLGMEDWLSQMRFAEDGTWLESCQKDALGWMGVIYSARVWAVVRATETLHLRVFGLVSPRSERTEKFNVQFQLSMDRHLPMRYALSEAQCVLLGGGWLNSMLFPTFQDCDIQEQLHPGVFRQGFFDIDLNWEQKKAVESIWSRSHGTLPYLISGPPGTGKTKTIIETTLQIVQNSEGNHHIVLCAPSDPAADTLCQRLIGHLRPGQMLRLNRPCRTFAEVPGALLPFCFIRNDQFSLPPCQMLVRYKVIVATCRDSSILVRARMTNRDLWAVQKGMQDKFATINPFQPAPEPGIHWSALLIDEAAQAMESEALVPLTVVAPPADLLPSLHAPLVVMAGDEHQLGPRTSLPSSPLRQSLFARLFKRPVYADHPLARGKRGEAPPPVTQSILPVPRPAFANLIRNYRSHPAILAVPSNLFYWDILEPEAKEISRLSTWEYWNGRRWPVLFHDNPSLDELELPSLMEGTGGWYNRGEADIACAYAQSLVRSGLVEQKEVCIMSPFKAQVRHIRKCIRKPGYGGLWDVNIGPTEAFQGLESGVVILCVTRARKKFVEQDQKIDWGIIGTPNKMNVALTRAKYGLIVVGKRELLVEDPNWKAFVSFCDRNGLVASPEPTDGRSGRGDAVDEGQEQTTRLEKWLIDKQRIMETPTGRLFGSIHGVESGQEMWTGGMVEAPDPNDYGHDNYEET